MLVCGLMSDLYMDFLLSEILRIIKTSPAAVDSICAQALFMAFLGQILGPIPQVKEYAFSQFFSEFPNLKTGRHSFA